MPRDYGDDTYGDGLYGGKRKETYLDGVIGRLLDVFPFIHPREDGRNFPEYVLAHQDEFDHFGYRLQDVKDSRYVNRAIDGDLDQLGGFLGKLGSRSGRNNDEYRQYLKTVVQSFRGRGTVPGVRFAVASGLDVPESQVQIVEDFNNLDFSITLHEWPPHLQSTVAELAELSDPSGVGFTETRYVIDEDPVACRDDVNLEDTDAIGDTNKAGDTVTTSTGPPGDMKWDIDNWDFAEFG